MPRIKMKCERRNRAQVTAHMSDVRPLGRELVVDWEFNGTMCKWVGLKGSACRTQM